MSYEAERSAMVAEQLIPRGIKAKKVLEALRKVPRHEFVSRELLKESHWDHPLPIGEGQTISQPYMVALMTEHLQLNDDESVLEIGTGSGYQAAILAELAGQVYSIERLEPLAKKAGETLGRLGYKNIMILTGDGSLGWPEHAPYDRILVTAGAPGIPGSLVRQLAEGGRLVIPVGGSFSQNLMVIEKKNGKTFAEEVCGCVFVPLVGKEGWGKG